MPPTPLIHRPQTLKQAKKAYRKSGGTTCLTESEKAALERRAVLQERADRIRERESRRKANIKKKEERIQKEREARHRMGIPTPPTKEGIQVGPSQLHLSGFMFAGVKRKKEDVDEGEERAVEIPKQEELAIQEQQGCPMEPPKSHQPLPTVSKNASPTWIMPSQIRHTISPKVRDFALQEDRKPLTKTPPDRIPLQARSANPTIQQKPLAGEKPIRELQIKAPYPPRPPVIPNDQSQPPRYPSIPTPITKPPIFKKPAAIPPLPKPETIPEDNFDDFFVSNTQIQRELSPPLPPPARTNLHTLPPSHTTTRPPTPRPPLHPPAADPDTATMLAFICTQDLDFTDELTQIGPLAPAPAPPPPHASPEISSLTKEEEVEEEEEKEQDEDFPDSELEDIVLEFSLDSPIKSSSPSSSSNTKVPSAQPPPADPLPLTPNNALPSTSISTSSSSSSPPSKMQPGLQTTPTSHETEASRVAEWDAFDLSTQDVMELAS